MEEEAKTPEVQKTKLDPDNLPDLKVILSSIDRKVTIATQLLLSHQKLLEDLVNSRSSIIKA
jgi:hypothetical protein